MGKNTLLDHAWLFYVLVVGVPLLALLVILCVFPRRRFIKSLKKKHVFITGGSSGIGLGIAHKALEQGAYVTIISRSASNLASAVDLLLDKVPSATADRIRCEVADVADYEALSVSIERAFAWRPIDVLVCNAGLTRGGYLGDCMLQDLQITMQTNFIGTVHTLHAALPLLKRYSSSNPVSIVITASLASMFLMYGHAVYTATKYAMRGLAEGLRFELIPYQIRVSVICPGFTSTPFLDEADKDADVRELLQWVDLYNRRWAESTNWVASHVIAAIKSGTFLVTTNPLGLVMATLSRGFVPADSFLRVIFELFFYVPFRLASLIYIPMVRLIVRHKTNTWIRKSTLCPMESSPEKHDESTS